MGNLIKALESGALNDLIEGAFEKGTYADNWINRKKKRVGQQKGGSKRTEHPEGSVGKPPKHQLDADKIVAKKADFDRSLSQVGEALSKYKTDPKKYSADQVSVLRTVAKTRGAALGLSNKDIDRKISESKGEWERKAPKKITVDDAYAAAKKKTGGDKKTAEGVHTVSYSKENGTYQVMKDGGLVNDFSLKESADKTAKLLNDMHEIKMLDVAQKKDAKKTYSFNKVDVNIIVQGSGNEAERYLSMEGGRLSLKTSKGVNLAISNLGFNIPTKVANGDKKVREYISQSVEEISEVAKSGVDFTERLSKKLYLPKGYLENGGQSKGLGGDLKKSIESLEIEKAYEILGM